jgi:hypothetical protein
MAVIETPKMEIMLPKAFELEAEELKEFLENTTVAGQQEFLNFVRGANFTRRLLEGNVKQAV